MDLRENTYYLILFTFLFFSVIIALYVIGSNIYDLHNSYVLSSQLSKFVHEGASIYYLGSYSYFENTLFEKHECYSQYEGEGSQRIICDNRPLPYYKTSFPLLLDLSAKNKYILIERGHIAYGPYTYFYLSITNKKLVIFEVNSLYKEEVENGFKNIIKAVPTNYIIGFCSNNYAILWVDDSRQVSKSDKTDFMKSYVLSEDLRSLLLNNGISNPYSSSDCLQKFKEIALMYDDFSPILVKITDNKNKCYENHDCLILTPNKKEWRYGSIKRDIYETYDLALLLFFKNYYGKVSKNGNYLFLEEEYRNMWKDMLNYYLPIVAARYDYLAKHKHFDEGYASCNNYFEQLSQKLCSNSFDSVCKMLNNKPLKEILQSLEEIESLYDEEVLKGCEGEIYM